MLSADEEENAKFRNVARRDNSVQWTQRLTFPGIVERVYKLLYVYVYYYINYQVSSCFEIKLLTIIPICHVNCHKTQSAAYHLERVITTRYMFQITTCTHRG